MSDLSRSGTAAAFGPEDPVARSTASFVTCGIAMQN